MDGSHRHAPVLCARCAGERHGDGADVGGQVAAAVPVDRLATFLSPILWAVTLISRGLTGGRAARAPYLTEEELITALHVSEEAGVIEEQEHQMIHGIIEIGDKTVREIMIPRT